MIAQRNRIRRSYSSAYEVLDRHRADFEAAKVSRFNRRRTGLPSMGAGADYHYKNEGDYLRVGEYARDMDRNDMFVGSVVDRAIANQIQTGFVPEPDTGDSKLDQDLKARWIDEKDEPSLIDHEEDKCFSDFERLAARDVAVVGDIFLILTDEGKLQVREQHRCRSPYRSTKNIVHGVELFQGSRRRKSYWFTVDDIDPFFAPSRIRVKDLVERDSSDESGNKLVLQMYDPKRFTQTRGITAFAPVFSAIGMHDDIEFATLLQRQVVSSFGWVEEKLDFFEPGTDDNTGASYDGSTGLMVQDVHPGMVVRPAKGVKLTPFSSNVPGPEFFPHVKLILTMIGINLGMPLVMALMDASETNFSGYRGAIDQARLGFRVKQQAYIRQLHRPFWKHRIRIWAEDDAPLRAKVERYLNNRSSRVKPFRHCWHAPAWPYIQPQEDASANMIRLATGQISRRRLDSENGLNSEEYECNVDRADEVEKCIELAEAINAKYGYQPGDPNYVQWIHLSTMPMADQIRINLSSSQQVGNANAQPAN